MQKIGPLAIAALIFLSALSAVTEKRNDFFMAGWGVDACISCHVPAESAADYIALLKQARLCYVRERNPDLAGTGKRLAVFRDLKKSGYHVVAFYELPGGLPPRQAKDDLPEDLMAVYHSAQKLAGLSGDAVGTWEMVGEPDTPFCRDLPDRVAAFQKAVYLGIKDEAAWTGRASPGVLMGALGRAPGPWLERAAANGLFDYTDAFNFHYYGAAPDLRGMIRANRNFAARFVKGRTLPLWITECGMNAVPEGRPDDAHAREIQRDFTLQTATIAREEGAAVFMPYILVHEGDGYALVENPTSLHPAWEAYADYTRAHSLSSQPAFAPPAHPARTVLQWLPDNRTCTPHKVSGAYWFHGGVKQAIPMTGSILIYNFSGRVLRGRVVVDAPERLSVSAGDGRVEVPPFSAKSRPLALNADRSRYFRGDVRVRFVNEDAPQENSALVFGVATRPRATLLDRVWPIAIRRPVKGDFQWIWAPEPFEISSEAGPWIGTNGVRAEGRDAAAQDSLSNVWGFEVPGMQADPRLPPMAITRVDGLPVVTNGFLRLRAPEDAKLAMHVRVDLVDRYDQRFTVADNLGKNWFLTNEREIYLSFDDFHLYPWGRCTKSPEFHPQDIREIQLRFYPLQGGGRTEVRLDVVSPGES